MCPLFGLHVISLIVRGEGREGKEGEGREGERERGGKGGREGRIRELINYLVL